MKARARELPQPEPIPGSDLKPLIDRIRTADERALAHLYDATTGKLYALAYAILRNAEDAEDIVCETYTYVWANAADYDAARGDVLGWLLMLCRSRALDWLRRRRHHVSASGLNEFAQLEGAANEQPEDLLSIMQQGTLVYAALAKLSAERRRLVGLAFLQGLSHHEIAAATQLPLGTVKSHLRRALVQLRAILEGT